MAEKFITLLICVVYFIETHASQGLPYLPPATGVSPGQPTAELIYSQPANFYLPLPSRTVAGSVVPIRTVLRPSLIAHRNCRAIHCANAQQLTWGIAGGHCFKFNNPCALTRENCERRNRKEQLLSPDWHHRCHHHRHISHGGDSADPH